MAAQGRGRTGALGTALPDGADAEWTGYRDGRTWLGWDAGHYFQCLPSCRSDDGHYVTMREAKHRVRALATMLETPPDDVAAVMRASAERWAWEASLYPSESEYHRHQRALALAGRDAALARLAEVTR